MKFHVLTLFPEMIELGINTSITGRAIEKGLISLNAMNIRSFSQDKHKRVDDYPYGGAGMVLQAEPVYKAYSYLVNKIKTSKANQIHLKNQELYMSPHKERYLTKVWQRAFQ